MPSFRFWFPAVAGLLFPLVSGAADPVSLRVTILDADTSQPVAARLYLRNQAGAPFFFTSAAEEGSAVRYEKQNWINAESTEYHTTVSPHPCVTEVPAGTYQLTVERGKHYFPEIRQLEIDGPVELTIPLRRWADPAARGWYSGDTHLHRTIADLKNVVLAEDLNVALPLTNWVTIADTPPAAGNKNLTEIPEGLIRLDKDHVIWPLNTEYEIFSVGGQRHTLGALFVLGHRDPLPQGVPPWKPVIDQANAGNPRVLFDMDKLDWPVAMLLPTIAPGALYELANNHVWRTEFAFREWNTTAPGFIHPPFGSSGGGHREWLDYTMGMYYTLLDCGLRLPPSAGTANGVHPVPAGFGRVYVHLPDGFDFDAWMEGLAAGRSFVTTGPFMEATADGELPGHVFQRDSSQPATPIEVAIDVHSEQPLHYGELLLNGRPIELLRPINQSNPSGSYRSTLQTTVRPTRSGWFAIRFWEGRPDGQSRFVHSAPWYVEWDDQPVRPRPEEKQYLLARMEQEIERSKAVLSAAALQEYERALAFYRNLPVAADSEVDVANTRPLPDATRDAWLDNMILAHRFTADEIHRATGLDRQKAVREIEARAGQSDSPASHSEVRLLPYPGGRHPRRGFLDGAVAPQRDTKVSVFPPWDEGGYVVVDVPEAIFSNLGLTYLAHTHIPTIWDEQSITLPPLEWQGDENALSFERELPGGIVFASSVTRAAQGVRMKIALTNGTKAPLRGLRVQVCNMLKGAIGFQTQEKHREVQNGPLIALRAENKDRWIITGWRPNQRVWTNPPVPCLHSDPIFPDCPPGETVEVTGGLWFYEGTDIDAELQRLLDTAF